MAIGENSPCFKFIKETLGVNLIGVEIGIWDGGNAEAVLNFIYPQRYYMIDPFREYPGSDTKKVLYDSTFETMSSKFGSYKNAIIMRLTSEEACKTVEDNLDFVYVDGAHDYENKMLDLSIWWPKIKLGGILCGDDFDIPDVTRAVSDFTATNKLSYTVLTREDPHPLEFIIIKGKP